MAYLAKARLEGAGASAADVEAMLERAAAALHREIDADFLEDEQVIETAKDEPAGVHRYRGRKVVYFDLAEQVVRAPVPGTPNFRA